MTIGHTLAGRGPEEVLVVHGWVADHPVFAPMLPYRDGERFTYAFIDSRGYGKSRDQKGAYTMREIAIDAIALADHFGWKRFHAIGHSMGGVAIQRLMLDAPGRVASLVALTPVPACG